MIELKNKADCCGCGACANICPKGCISMRADEEGFLYPQIDIDICVGCNMCEKACPVLNASEARPFEQSAYIVQNTDENIRRESTAGGAFTAIAQYVIDKGGVVFGAAFGDNFRVHHTCVEKEDELRRFRNSKYVQSDTEKCYQKVPEFLKQGRWVCYSGTPCQIEGLYSFLGRKYDNLITVDIVCHAVPSPLVWEKYVQMQKDRFGENISNILFRDKHHGYKYSAMTLMNDEGKKVYAFGIDTDPMLRAFFSNICDRPSCYECRFKKRYRVSDFTIWDCYPVYKFDKKMDDDKGTTRLLIHSDKGREIFSEIKGRLRTHAVEPDDLTANVREMFASVAPNIKREQFFNDAKLLPGEALFGKYFPRTLKVELERFMRLVLIKTGTYSMAKRAVGSLPKKQVLD